MLIASVLLDRFRNKNASYYDVHKQPIHTMTIITGNGGINYIDLFCLQYGIYVNYLQQF